MFKICYTRFTEFACHAFDMGESLVICSEHETLEQAKKAYDEKLQSFVIDDNHYNLRIVDDEYNTIKTTGYKRREKQILINGKIICI